MIAKSRGNVAFANTGSPYNQDVLAFINEAAVGVDDMTACKPAAQNLDHLPGPGRYLLTLCTVTLLRGKDGKERQGLREETLPLHNVTLVITSQR